MPWGVTKDYIATDFPSVSISRGNEISGMAEASLSDFFCDSIVDFLTESSISEFDQLLDEDGSASAAGDANPRPISPHPSSFEAATPTDLQRFKDKNLNRNTAKSTSTWVNRFESWRKWKNLPNRIEQIAEGELDGVLQQFYAEVRKADSSQYEPDSLRTMLAALDRHLRQNGAIFSIINDRQFEESRKTLNGRAIILRERGMGKKKNKADALTPAEEEQLWTKKVLGGDTPISLNHTVFFMVSQQFGTRGCQEHHQL